ncbi:GroES chaperonin family [uncultured Caudovirales phage]|uniref:GroES chaperonin family n=1 Tax=uncultured Caudovirales phage TaxID=2100421 RepID=A0A6J5M8E2_9CAUD|nr:GroES chaperonin family [uncultured Caudovirales phage]
MAEVGEKLDEVFPEADPGARPLGTRILIQLRSPKLKSAAGIIFAQDTKDTEKWNTQVGKVMAMGPLAFRNRQTQEPWPEGSWVSIGEFVRVPKYGGDRWEVKIDEDRAALFVVFNDHELITAVTGDPLQMRAFL